MELPLRYRGLPAEAAAGGGARGARAGRTAAPAAPLPGAALGRPAAARRRGPRGRGHAAGAPGRRADRQPRFHQRRRRHGAAARAARRGRHAGRRDPRSALPAARHSGRSTCSTDASCRARQAIGRWHDGRLLAGPALRAPRPQPESGVHGDRRAHPRARHRRQHRDLQRGQRRAAPPAGLHAARPAGRAARAAGRPRSAATCRCRSRSITICVREVPALRDLAAVWPININLTGSGRAGADPGRGGEQQLLLAARRGAGVGPRLHQGRRPGPDRLRRAHLLRPVAAALRRRPGGDREDRAAGRRPDHHHRRHAARIPPPGGERRLADGALGADRAGQSRTPRS